MSCSKRLRLAVENSTTSVKNATTSVKNSTTSIKKKKKDLSSWFKNQASIDLFSKFGRIQF